MSVPTFGRLPVMIIGTFVSTLLYPVLNIPLRLSPLLSQVAYSRETQKDFKTPFLIPSTVLVMWTTGVRFTGLHIMCGVQVWMAAGYAARPDRLQLLACGQISLNSKPRNIFPLMSILLHAAQI